MKPAFLIPLVALLFMPNGFSQERIYRCGNEYTNTVTNAKAKGCKLIESANVTVVPGTKPAARASVPAAASSGAQRIDSAEQRARDSDARLILESELRKALARQAELHKEYNNGEPEKVGGEARNYQKYLDRVAELKANLARNESDIAGIRRELARLGGAGAK